MVTHRSSDGRLFSIASLIIVGRILLVPSFFSVATSFSFGWPATHWGVITGAVLGLGAAFAGAALVERDWTSLFIQVLHQSAAVAGVLFLAVTVRRVVEGVFVTSFPLTFCFVLSLTAVISWWLRARRHPLRRNRNERTVRAAKS